MKKCSHKLIAWLAILGGSFVSADAMNTPKINDQSGSIGKESTQKKLTDLPNEKFRELLNDIKRHEVEEVRSLLNKKRQPTTSDNRLFELQISLVALVKQDLVK